jgi:predicted Zn-dependent protease
MSIATTPIRARGRKPASRAVALFTALSLGWPGSAAQAQPANINAGIPQIRDTEIEQLLREYTNPILRAAGLGQQNIRVIIIANRTFNAFVMDGRRIFVNVGALLDSTTPNQIIGVLAHEAGHIAGGHLAKLREQLASIQTAALIGMLAGAGAVIAGSTTGGGTGSGLAQAGAAAMSAPMEMARRSLLSYQRTQEEAADRAGVKFLNDTGQSTKGMYETFKRFADQIQFTASTLDPYLQSHPLPMERVRALESLAKSSPLWDKKDPAELQLRHDLMRAKLSAFIERPETVARKYPLNDTSLAARYARAIAGYRHYDIRSALAQMDALIQTQPNNPYFWELKGQALLETGHPAEAIAPLRHAVSLAPNAPLIQIMLGQALVATNNPKYADESINLLRNALSREPETPQGYTQLAMAYGRKGDLAQADLASAQAAFTRNDIKTARELAARAKTRFPVGTPGWVKADDIVNVKLPSSQFNRR